MDIYCLCKKISAKMRKNVTVLIFGDKGELEGETSFFALCPLMLQDFFSRNAHFLH